LQLNHAVRLLGIEAQHEANLCFKITGQNELFQILAIQMAIAFRDSWLTCVSVCLRRIQGNLQKCIPSHGNIVSGATLLDWRMDVPNLPGGMVKSLAGKDDSIESITTRCLGLLHKHNMGCGVTLVPWIESTCEGGWYRISVVIR
jgi:hypothetical protein